MRIALVLTPMTESNLRLAAQVGVDEIVGRYPGASYEALVRLRDRVASHGMRLGVVEGYIPHDLITHGKPGRDAQIEQFASLLRNMGRAGVPVCCYNFMPDDDWTRTSDGLPDRAGALVTGFDARDLQGASHGRGGAIDDAALWDNLRYFLARVVPVAEDVGVRLAMHPDDPPMSPLRGQARIMSSLGDFERLVDIDGRAANGVCFCQGCFGEMGEDVPGAIRRLGSRIHYVHFRNVIGCVPCFRESFHDNGQIDMAAAMRAYRQIGFGGPMRPDHVPTLEGESNENPGYAMLGRLFAVGYMRGLIQATAPRGG